MACDELKCFSPVLLVQGGVVTSVKLASEKTIIEAGSTIVEGLDRLFKLFWLCDMSYMDSCSNVYRFLEHYIFQIQDNKKLPATIVELCSYLKS